MKEKWIFNDGKEITCNECCVYLGKFLKAKLKDNFVKQAVSIIKKMNLYADKYSYVSTMTKVPSILVGIIHYLETNFSMTSHLHNGDPLTERTIHIPIGRPKTGNPPFTWEDSAIDALYGYGCDDRWNIGMALYTLERYNGLGYRRRGIESPYLWSGTDLYTKGKYVYDGTFNPEAVSKQIGGAVILRVAMLKYFVELEDTLKAIDVMLNG